MQDFHNIRAWKKAHALAIAVKRLTNRFPKTEYRRLRNQMVDSSESIADTIAEGAGAVTNAEFARFLAMSLKSTSELENQLERAYGYGLTRQRESEWFLTEVRDVRKMTWGLRKKVLGTPESAEDGQADDGQTGRNTHSEQRRTDARAVPPVRDPSSCKKPTGQRMADDEKRAGPP